MCFQHIDKNHQNAAAGAVVADKIGQTGVAAAMVPNIVVEHVADTDCTVVVTEKVAAHIIIGSSNAITFNTTMVGFLLCAIFFFRYFFS